MTTALFEPAAPDLYAVRTSAPGPDGALPLTDRMLREAPSGEIFGLSQNVGMGADPARSADPPALVLSTQGGMRDAEGRPLALGYHTGHYELGTIASVVARELTGAGLLPFAGFVSDPCDGRSQGTTAMFDSLPYRNDAAIVMRRLVRSLPGRVATVGIATCDKGLPAMMMALAGTGDRAAVLVPGGVTLPPEHGEDAGTVQTLGARYVHRLISLEEAAQLGCVACASPGGGCQFLGTAASAQVVGEALGMAVGHSALAPSGEPVWLEGGVRAARAAAAMAAAGATLHDVLGQDSVHNAMVVHAAFGGSTNLLLHIPAIAHAAGLRRPTQQDWLEVSRATPRIVSVLPNGPVHHPTVRAYLAGGVPEVMLHLRRLGLLRGSARTVEGTTLDERLDAWEASERRTRFREVLSTRGIDPDDVVLSPERAAEWGVRRTVAFPRGSLAPEGSVVKTTAIDPSRFDADGVLRFTGPARVFTSEKSAVAAVKEDRIRGGDVIVLLGCGPLGTGMEETYQLTSALRHLPIGKEVVLLTDARFSGVSTGACIGHVGPEALAGGPIGKVREGDRIRVEIDTGSLTGSIDLVGTADEELSPEQAEALLARRGPAPGLAPDAALPDDTRLWAALQQASGGTWGGCVYDVEALLPLLGSSRSSTATTAPPTSTTPSPA
ncbi:putative YjhG/YagF family dehydratase [Motilibacter rhizosphaerae]|uniref:Putative YjhG/YagF family dehydratase n=1 Tax=Motilibacter rhizosphaerae TaxID=598652 RepID=A0A4Q7NAR0_9ACTN|nr:YjhG/YagF family D-xylonate dehydratase [Motilibacter rhizosphaerae]RZS80032.1 putative YjhG/YagF family dehydratase [Motilibacter rhizosphaerae]